MKELVKYIYENPGDHKLYRREVGADKRELIGNQTYKPIGNKKVAVIFGAGGFIGSHLAKELKRRGYWVRGVDLKYPEFSKTCADDFIIADLRHRKNVKKALDLPHVIDELYQLAADMGGASYLFTGENDADVMHNSALINLYVCEIAASKEITNWVGDKKAIRKIFYSSSACIYPKYNQTDPNNPKCSEDSAYPADPDSEYGWEKLFSERLYLAFKKNYGINVIIARYHNIFGPEGTWVGGKEKAPAALCRKVADADDDGCIEVWGDGEQTRSFLYIDECIEATLRLMDSKFTGPVNIGSDEMVSINDFARMIIEISCKDITIENISGPEGVRGRNSDNKLIKKELGWKPSTKLVDGLEETYDWIEEQLEDDENYSDRWNTSDPILTKDLV